MLTRCLTAGALFVTILLAAAGPAVYADGTFHVTRVIDGDTIEVNADTGRTFRVRLASIDAPEAGQPGARAAKTRLAELVLQKHIALDIWGADNHRRVLACPVTSHMNVCEVLLREGLVWVYRIYREDAAIMALENKARSERLGLWQTDDAIAPWDWRAKAHRRPKTTRPAPTASSEGCRIKGNISSNGRIYHLPHQKYYARTRISPERGERFFCSEADARAAGWRKARE